MNSREADFDAHMTSVVFEALLHFSKQAPVFVALVLVAAPVVRILLLCNVWKNAMASSWYSWDIYTVYLMVYTSSVILYTVQVDDFIETNPPVERKRKRTLQSSIQSAAA